MSDFVNKWVPDGKDAWKTELGGGRVARVGRKRDSWVARLTGGDPGGGACGNYPTLDAAKMRFEPGWTPAHDAELMKTPDAARKAGPKVDVDAEFKARIAAQSKAQPATPLPRAAPPPGTAANPAAGPIHA